MRLGSARPYSFKLLRLAIHLIVSATLVSCGGGGGQVASSGVGGTGGGAGGGDGGGNGGVGGTGIVALGSIAGFGSVIVNGTHFEVTRDTKIRVNDNNAATVSDLKLGMVVAVDAYQDTETQKTEAKTITYRSNVTGPIGQIAPGCKSMTVLGQIIEADSNTLPALSRGLCDFTQNEVVEVSGLVTDTKGNTIRATLIQRQTAPPTQSLSGQISSIDPRQRTFVVGGLSVYFGIAEIKPAGTTLHQGDHVSVTGTETMPGRLTAATVIVAQSGLGAGIGDHAEIEGFVTDLDADTFRVNGQSVEVSAAVIEPTGAELRDGQRVEVEGKVDSRGVVVAQRIEIKSEAMLIIEGTVDGTAPDSITILGQMVFVASSTEFVDKSRLQHTGFRLSDINVYDHLVVTCYRTSRGKLVASKVERRDSNDRVVVEGPVESTNATANTFTIAYDNPITIFVSSNHTEFWNVESAHITAAEFFAVTDKGLRVKVVGIRAFDTNAIDATNGIVEIKGREYATEPKDRDEPTDPAGPEDPETPNEPGEPRGDEN